MRLLDNRRPLMLQFLVIVSLFLIQNCNTLAITDDIDAALGRQRRLAEPDVASDPLQPYVSTGSLTYEAGNFVLNGSTLRILSGAIHYFRTVPEYWKDRLLKLKACGLNTVETYVSWNLHEEYPGEFNFEGMLDIRRFIQTAHELGIYVILRPGPYICAEWEFGGLPGWLLRDPAMRTRANYPGYLEALERYFPKLLEQIVDLQYSHGGPIIAVQLENEYGSFTTNTSHLMFLKKLFIEHGVVEMFVTSDNHNNIMHDVFYDEALPTANFKQFSAGQVIFDLIRTWNNDFPLMVMEFWTGWFDLWGNRHSKQSAEEYGSFLEQILQAGASFNLYMFQGGTNFGFMSGASDNEQLSDHKTDVTNYDYDGILKENGDITPKYMKTRELLQKYIYTNGEVLPDIPANVKSAAYGTIPRSDMKYLPLEDYLQTFDPVTVETAVSMELLNHNNGYGQNFGYTLYRTEVFTGNHRLEFTKRPRDRAQIFIEGREVGVVDWQSELSLEFTSGIQEFSNLDILVENLGRVNWGNEANRMMDRQRKGLEGDVLLSDRLIPGFQIYPLEFKGNFSSCCSGQWQEAGDRAVVPGLFKTKFTIEEEPADTFVYMKGWGKGVVFVNDFNLGRYWSIGPQQTLYVPAPWLQTGTNKIVWFEQERLGEAVVLTDTAITDVNDQSTINL